MNDPWKGNLKCFVLGVALTAAAFLWVEQFRHAKVDFDPLGGDWFESTLVLHTEVELPKWRHEEVAKTLKYCQPESLWHYYPCRCGKVKP